MRSPFQVHPYFTYDSPRYVNKDRAVTKRIVQQAEKRGIKALFITVDAPQLGRREKVRSASVELEMRGLKRENRICV